MKKGLLAAALAVMLTLTACSGAVDSGSDTAEDLPRLVIASDNYEPYSYVGPNGNLIGVDVDLATEACRRLGYAPEFRQIVWENKDVYLSIGQVDCLQPPGGGGADGQRYPDLGRPGGPPGGGAGHGQAGEHLPHL